jgi:Holliday junction DNA helicase RuvA
VGKKTAERIVVELKDKIGKTATIEPSGARPEVAPEDAKFGDAVAALMALGFKQPEAHDAIRAAHALLGTQASVEQLVRAALKKGA